MGMDDLHHGTAPAPLSVDQARIQEIEEIQDFMPLEDDPVLLSEQFPDAKWSSLEFRKGRFCIIATAMILVFLPLRMTEPVTVDIKYDAICRNMNVPAGQCFQSPEVNKKMSDLSSANNIVTILPTIVMIPVMTAVSESSGYMTGLVVVLASLAVSSVSVYPLTYMVPAHWTIYRLLLVDLVDAVVGSTFVLLNMLVLVTAQLFPEPELRPRYMGYLRACIAIPSSVAPMLGGFLTRHIKTRDFFIFTAILHIISIIFFVRFVKLPRFILSEPAQEEIVARSREGTPVEPRVPIARGGRQWSYLKEQAISLRVFQFAHIRAPSVRMAAIIITVCRVFTDTDPSSVVIIYAKQFFNWDKAVLGTLMSGIAAEQMFWALLGFPILQSFILKYWPANAAGVDMVDKTCLFLGILSQSLGFFIMSIATSSSQYIAGRVISVNSYLAVLIMKPAILKFVPPSEGAALITALSLLDAIASKIVPSFVTWVYGQTLSWWPTFEFQMECGIAGLLAIAILLFVKTTFSVHLDSHA